MTIYLRLDGGLIADAKFEARGCAISLASASMMTEMIRGMTEQEARDLFERFHALVTDGSGEGEDMEELGALSGVRRFPTRIKCATLAWHAMTAALNQVEDEIRTE